MNYSIVFIALWGFLSICACTTAPKTKKNVPVRTANSISIANTISDTTIRYAKGFSIQQQESYTLITIRTPWPGAKRNFKYILYPKTAPKPTNFPDAIPVPTPIESVIATATPNIPMLEALSMEETLIGFPNTDYISSAKTRQLISKGKIQDIGVAHALNTEVVLQLKPELVIGFSSDGNTKALAHIQRHGIPVLFNGAWMEPHPLGRAEWIKCLGAFFGVSPKADTIFNTIETKYNTAKTIAQETTEMPTVLAGSLFKDVWYLPGGRSYKAQLFKDAHIHYLWNDNSESGAIKLNFESVFHKAQQAELWIGSGTATSLDALEKMNPKYVLFRAFQNKNVYSYALTKGERGGLLYFEQGPMHPDLILKDLIKIAHPQLLQDYQSYFFKKLP